MSEPKPEWDHIRVDPLVPLALLIVVAGAIALGLFPSPAIALATGGLFRQVFDDGQATEDANGSSVVLFLAPLDAWA